jgi:hypothetical protein
LASPGDLQHFAQRNQDFAKGRAWGGGSLPGSAHPPRTAARAILRSIPANTSW